MTADLLRLDDVEVRLGGREILRDVSFGLRAAVADHVSGEHL